MAEHENESFAEFCARQKAGLQLVSEAEQQEYDKEWFGKLYVRHCEPMAKQSIPAIILHFSLT